MKVLVMLQWNNGLNNLLEFHNEVMYLDNKGRFYSKFEAKICEPNEHIPHGIRYSLTLHDKKLSPSETRIFGIDNSHGGKFSGSKHTHRKVEWDHMHKNEKITYYDFENSEKLMVDFWENVKTILAIYEVNIG